MASTVFTLPFIPALGINGTPQSGAKLYFYDAGTTTPRAVYTDADLSVAHANPVVADGAGRFDPIYLDPAVSYRIILQDALGGELGDIDNFTADPVSANLAANDGSSLVGFIRSETGAVARTLQDKAREIISIDDFGTAQEAIDALPSTGGTIIVNSDHSALVPGSLTVATNKMVTWELGPDGSLPDDMPGAVITSGYRDQPHENTAGTGTRPGAAMVRYLATNHTPDTATANQQDSIIYAEGAVPSVDIANDQEFAAFRFNMTSEAFRTGTSAPSVDIKGIQGVVVSYGGGAKARAIRTTTYGLNGSSGIVSGAMFAAVRGGIVPTAASWGGDGTTQFASGTAGPYGPGGDAAIIGQVGPGIQSALRLEGFAGPERPQYMIQQASGGQAMLPELGVMLMHGGGNGKLITVYNDESLGTEIARWEKTGYMACPAFRSNINAITLADNASTSFTLARSSGFIAIEQANGSTTYSIFHYRSGAGTEAATSIGTGASAVLGTGAFPADDGTAKADFYIEAGALKIRNRLGGSASFTYTVF